MILLKTIAGFRLFHLLRQIGGELGSEVYEKAHCRKMILDQSVGYWELGERKGSKGKL